MNKPHNINFVVRQSRLLNSLLTGFFGLIFIGVCLTYLVDEHSKFSNYAEPFSISLAMTIIGLANSIRRREILRINNKGLFYHKILITSWQNFHHAYWSDVSSTGSLDDKIILFVQFYNQDGILMVQKLPMPNSQDKSVSHIISEIQREVQEQADKATTANSQPGNTHQSLNQRADTV